MSSGPRIAFVIDALTALGGGEKVLFTALEAYPLADVFTLVYNRDAFAGTPLADRKVHTTFIDRLPYAHTHHRRFLPLMPAAIASLDLGAYDRIVSFSYAVAHGARSQNGARHLSYTYTPMRYAWTDINIDGRREARGVLLNQYMRLFRRWDRQAAARVDAYASISEAIARRIRRAYDRDAPVIYPPVEIERFDSTRPREDFYITVSRLVPHKQMHLLIEAFTDLGLPLVIVGEGPERPMLERTAPPNVKLVGYQPDKVVADLLERARGFVCAAEEDFGIAIVESQAAGCPVIAYAKGGALETVREGVTGVYFREQTPASLIEAVREFEGKISCFRAADVAASASRFGSARFLGEFRVFVEGAG